MLGMLPLLFAFSLLLSLFGREWARASGLLRRNIIGRPTPTAVGFVVVLPQAVIILTLSPPGDWAMAATMVGFAAMGLYDDVICSSDGGQRDVKGWRGHLSSLARGRLTSGAAKILAGGMVAGAVVGSAAADPVTGVRDIMIVALCANLINGLDVAPGRAVKGLVLVLTLLIIGRPELGGQEAAGVLIPPVAFSLGDLRGRHMMGDAGANGWGAMLGMTCIAGLSGASLWILLFLLCWAQLIADSPGFSRVIERCPPLRYLDRLGCKSAWKRDTPLA